MSVRAYVLVETLPGKNVKNVRGNILRIKGVKFADYVTGPVDVVAQIEAKDMDGITEIVTDKIQAVRGVARTTTLVSLS
jgi:DNA-binding Lrp family transcriptional regulator